MVVFVMVVVFDLGWWVWWLEEGEETKKRKIEKKIINE